MSKINDDAQSGPDAGQEGATEGTPSPSGKTNGKKIVLTARFEGLIDIVEHQGNSAFLLIREGQPIVTHELEDDCQIWMPPPIENIPWGLANGSSVLDIYEQETNPKEVNAKLFDDLVSFFKSVAELPSDEHYDLIAAWEMHTYLLEAAQYSPIIWFYAVAERGKSRTGKAMIFIAWRGLYVESLREPYIIRMAKHFQATIFFDVLELSKKAEAGGSADTLLTRYEKGTKVPKVMYPELGPHRDIEYFETFGATIAATNMPVHEILESRCIQINMQESAKAFDSVVKPEMARPFKERLLAFRARHLADTLPEVQKPARSRLGDILRPIRQIIKFVRPEREIDFLLFVEKLEMERRNEKSSSVEAQIITAVNALERKVTNCKLALKLIVDHFNAGRSENQKWTPHYMARRLSSLGLQKATMPDSTSAILWDEGLLGRLCERYGLPKRPGKPVSPGTGAGARSPRDPGLPGLPGLSPLGQNSIAPASALEKVEGYDESPLTPAEEQWLGSLTKLAADPNGKNE